MIQVNIKFLPLSLNAEDAGEYIGSRQVLNDMRAAGWINPLVARHRMTLFDTNELQKCYARFYAGEYPGEKK
jgi:hypothetical protein